MPDPPVRPVAMSLLPLTLFTLVVSATLVSSAPMHDHVTQLEEYYGGSSETGCYYNFLHYEEGNRIITNEPCLNCTCHNRMLMCYLRVCPFTKAIGQDCTIEKKPDQCCPVITCPQVPVHLLTSSTTAITPPAPTGSTALGMPDNYGCSINEYFYTDGAQVPGDPSKPCELCYCIRNKTACVMQECTLQVEGCRPVYQEGICCPVRYDCDYQIDVTTGLPLLETTVRTTPGLLLTTTTAGPLDCFHNGEMFGDGASIRRVDKPCEHCYCMRGEIVCAVQECGTPLEKEAKNCTALPPEPGKCCPQQYQCDTKIVHVNDLYLRQNRKHENSENDNTTIPFEIMSQEKETTPHLPIQDVSTSGPHKEEENVAVTEATVVEEGSLQEHTDQQENGDQDIESQEHLNEVDHSDHETHVEEPVIAEGEIEHEVSQQQVTQGIDILSTHGVTGTTKEHRTTSEDIKPTESIENAHVTESVPEGSSPSLELSEATPGLIVTPQEGNAESELSTETTHNTVSVSDVSHDTGLSGHHTEGVPEISSDEPTKLGDSTADVSDQTTEPVQVGHQTTSPGEGLVSGSESTVTVPEKPDDIVHFPGSESVESVTESGAEMTTSQKEKVSEMTVLPVVAEGEPSESATGPSHVPSLDTSSSGPSSVDGEAVSGVDQGTTIINEMDLSTQPSVEVHPVKPSEDEQTTDTDVEKNPNETQPLLEETVTNSDIKEETENQVGEVTPSGIVEATTVLEEHKEEIDEVEKTTTGNLSEEQTVVAVHDEKLNTTVESQTTVQPQNELTPDTVSETSTQQTVSEGEKPSEAVEHEAGEHVPTDNSDIAATTEKAPQPIEETMPTIADELLHHPVVESEPSPVTEESDNSITTEQSPENEINEHEIPSTVLSEGVTVSHPVEAVEDVGGEEMHKPENIVTTTADVETATEQILEGGLITTIKENLVASGPVSDNQVIEEESSMKPEPGVEETNAVTDESHKEAITTAGSVSVTPEGPTDDAEHLDHTEHSETHTNPDDNTEGQIHHVTSEINGKPTEITATSSEEMGHKPTPQAPVQEPEAVTSETLVPSSPAVSEIQTEVPGPAPEKPDSDNLLSGEPESTGGYIPELSTDVIENGPAGIELTTAEHGLIPGEGSCLVDGITYINNSDVPPAGQCHLSCRCISSIVHCESISCPPPPPHFTNCMPIQHGEGSCCPTYTCDGDNKVTLESDSHLAGTESPTGETKHPSDDTPAEHGTLKPEYVEIVTTAKPHPEQTEEQPESPIQTGGSGEYETDQNQVEEKPELPVSPTEDESEVTLDKETEHVQAPIDDKTDTPVVSNEEKPVESSEKEPDQHLPENGGVISLGETVIPTVEPIEAEQHTDRPLTPNESEGTDQPPAEPVEQEVEGSGNLDHVTTAIPEHIHNTPKQPEESDHQITSTPGLPLEQDSHTPEDMAVPGEPSLPAEPVQEHEEIVQTTPRQPSEVTQGQENTETPEHSTPNSEISDDKLTIAAESDLKPTGSTVESDEQPTENNQDAVEHETSTEQQQSHSSEATIEIHKEQTEHSVEQPTIPETDKPEETVQSVDQATTSPINEDNESISQVTESHDAMSVSNESESKPHEETVTSQGIDGQVSIQQPNPTAPPSGEGDKQTEGPLENETGNEMQHGGQETNPSEPDIQQTAAPPSEEGDKQTERPEENLEQQTVGPTEDVTEHQTIISQGETGDQQAVITPEENEEQQTTGPLFEDEIHQTSKPHETEDHTAGSVDEAPASSTEQEEASPAAVESNASPGPSTESETVQIVTSTVASTVSKNDVEHGEETEMPPETNSEPSVVSSIENEPVVAVSSTEADENQNVPTEYPHEMTEGSTHIPIVTEGGQDKQPIEHEEQTSDNILESDEMLPVSPSQEQDILSVHPEETTDIVIAPIEAEIEQSTNVPSSEDLLTEVDKTPPVVSSEGEYGNQQPTVVPSETEVSTQPQEVHVSEMEGDTQSAQVTSTEKIENAQPQEPESQTQNEKEEQGVTTQSSPVESEDNEIEKDTVSGETVQHATVPSVDVTSKETVESAEHEEISIVTVMPEKEHSVPAIESMLGQGDEMTSSPQSPHVVESTILPASSSNVTDTPQHPGINYEEHSSASPAVEPVVIHEEVTTQVAEETFTEKPNESTEKDSTDVIIQEEIKPTGVVTEEDEHQSVSPVETENQIDTQTESQQVDLSPVPEVPSQFETVHTDKPVHSDGTTTEVPTSSQQEVIVPSQEPAGTEIDDNQQTVHHEGEETVSHKPTSESTAEASSEQPISLTESSDLTTEFNISDLQEEIPEAITPPDSGDKLPQEPIEEDTGKPSEIHSTEQPELPPNYSETSEKPVDEKPISSHPTETSDESTEVSNLPGQPETVSESHTEKQPELPPNYSETSEKPVNEKPISSHPTETSDESTEVSNLPGQPETVSESHTEKQPELPPNYSETSEKPVDEKPISSHPTETSDESTEVSNLPGQPETVSESHTEKQPELPPNYSETSEKPVEEKPISSHPTETSDESTEGSNLPGQPETVSESHTEKQPELPPNYSETSEKPVDEKPISSHPTETSDESTEVSNLPGQPETVSESHTEKQPELPPNYSETSEKPVEEKPISSHPTETSDESTEVSNLPGQPETVSESHTEKQPTSSEQESHKPPADLEYTPAPPVTTDESIVSTDHVTASEHDNEQVTETVHTSSKATLTPGSLVIEEINQTQSTGNDSSTQPADSTEASHPVHEPNENKESTFNTPAPTEEKLSTSMEHDVSTSKDSPALSSSTELPPDAQHKVNTSSQEASMESETHSTHTTTTLPTHEYFTEGHASIPGEGIEHVTEGTKKPTHHFTTRPPVTEDHHRPGQNSEEQFEQFPTGDGDYQAPTSGETDFGDEDQAAFGSGTCRYGGKMYVSAQQIPRDDPCDFCFCFRSDIICLQQSCPPPIHGCHEEPIQGFCCPRYECPVSMALVLNTTTTTTTTTTALPPHFLPHVYKGSVQRTGCQVQGQAYRVGEIVHSASGPCLQCRCGGNGQMECNPKECSPEPMLRKMIMAAASRRR